MTDSTTTQTTPETDSESEAEARTESEDAEQTTASALETCPECDGQLEYDAEHGEQVCTACGLVVDDAMRYLFGNASDNNDSSGSNRDHYDWESNRSNHGRRRNERPY